MLNPFFFEMLEQTVKNVDVSIYLKMLICILKNIESAIFQC